MIKPPKCQRFKVDGKMCKGNGCLNVVVAYFNGYKVCQKCAGELKYIQTHPVKSIERVPDWLREYYKNAK